MNAYADVPQHLCIKLTEAFDDSRASMGPFLEGKRQVVLSRTEVRSRQIDSAFSFVCLSELLSTQRTDTDGSRNLNSLSMSDRINLAVDLTSSFFYIFGTPWYRSNFGKEIVCLDLEDQSARRKKRTAHLEHHFPQESSLYQSTAHDPEDAFVRLSICLAELCLGMPIETLSAYKKFCGPDGKAHSSTARAAVPELFEEVELRLGFSYCAAVRKCYAHAMQIGASKTSDPHFWQQAHDDIVQPLQKVLDVWVESEVL
ncbi:MAG: hypothetical protein Q9162_005003 [Coniocarpon cinnabarinum]